MKIKSIILVFIVPIFCFGNCRNEEEQRQSFIIRNNSDKEIIIINSFRSVVKDTSCFIQNMTKIEYQDFIYYRMIPPHSNKNFERARWGESMISHPNDTLYIGVFYRTDIDEMSCEEFEQAFPLKKEWKVTVADMEEDSWTLVYPVL